MQWLIDHAQNDVSGSDDYLGYAWATALNGIFTDDSKGVIGTLVLGGNNESGTRGGAFHSFVVMPWYWIKEKKLQAVIQYQYQGSERAEGVQMNRRYLRSEISAGSNINSGIGDKLHTVYAGLNYQICSNNAKIMSGVEYANLWTPNGAITAMTYTMAYRMFF